VTSAPHQCTAIALKWRLAEGHPSLKVCVEDDLFELNIRVEIMFLHFVPVFCHLFHVQRQRRLLVWGQEGSISGTRHLLLKSLLGLGEQLRLGQKVDH